jgi:hypothetical protein
MGLKTPLAAGLGLLAAAYIAYPFLTLYRIQSALAHDDTKTLRSLVDWPSVRAGIENDVAAQRQGDELPAFGASFMRAVAVKTTVTPAAICAVLRDMGTEKTGGATIRSAWMEGPGTLMLDLGGVRVRMAMQGGIWHVTRVWLPRPVLTAAASRGSEG